MAIEAAVSAKDLGKIRAPTVTVQTRKLSGEARVIIEDNAGGLPEGFEAHLYEPFVTSKPKGIGLGLSMARRALEQQGGSILFDRTEGGTRFVVGLPLARERSEQHPRATAV